MSDFTLRVHADVASFLDVALDALAVHETANNLILGVPLRLRAHPERIQHAPTLLTVQNAAGVLAGAAIRTPPFHLVVHVEAGLSETEGMAVLDAIVHGLAAQGAMLNGVNGPVPWSERFAACWHATTGLRPRLGTALRTFELRAVTDPPPAPGLLRQALMADLPAVSAYLRAFDAEALPEAPYERSDDSIRLAIEDGAIFLWEDGGVPVSLVGRSRPLLRTITIAPVYTPPALRGRGYAGNAVAQVSRHLLDAGWEACSLFTDLANPISNSLYQKIGYRPVCDYADFIFEEPQRSNPAAALEQA